MLLYIGPETNKVQYCNRTIRNLVDKPCTVLRLEICWGFWTIPLSPCQLGHPSEQTASNLGPWWAFQAAWPNIPCPKNKTSKLVLLCPIVIISTWLCLALHDTTMHSWEYKYGIGYVHLRYSNTLFPIAHIFAWQLGINFHNGHQMTPQ